MTCEPLSFACFVRHHISYAPASYPCFVSLVVNGESVFPWSGYISALRRNYQDCLAAGSGIYIAFGSWIMNSTIFDAYHFPVGQNPISSKLDLNRDGIRKYIQCDKWSDLKVQPWLHSHSEGPVLWTAGESQQFQKIISSPVYFHECYWNMRQHTRINAIARLTSFAWAPTTLSV